MLLIGFLHAKRTRSYLQQECLHFSDWALDSRLGLFGLDLSLASFQSYARSTVPSGFSSRSPLTFECEYLQDAPMPKSESLLCNYQIKFTLLTS